MSKRLAILMLAANSIYALPTNNLTLPCWVERPVAGHRIEWTAYRPASTDPSIYIDLEIHGGQGYSLRWKPTFSWPRWEYVAVSDTQLSGARHIAKVTIAPKSVVGSMLIASNGGFFAVLPKYCNGTRATSTIHGIDLHELWPQPTNAVPFVGPLQPSEPPPIPGM